ncbi:hypothetical protein IAT38_006772 [Cryptococcus sp. DSM 104549]
MGVCYSTHCSADCCCDNECCGPCCDFCCDRRPVYRWGGPRGVPPPIVPLYPLQPIQRTIIVPPAPIPPPLIPYPSGSFAPTPPIFPSSTYGPSPAQYPQYPPQQNIYLVDRPHSRAHYPEQRHSYQAQTQARQPSYYESYYDSQRQRERPARRYSLDEHATGHHQHHPDPRRVLTPEPHTHTSRRLSGQAPKVHESSPALGNYRLRGEDEYAQEKGGDVRPRHYRSASTSAALALQHEEQHRHHHELSEGSAPYPPRHSFDHHHHHREETRASAIGTSSAPPRGRGTPQPQHHPHHAYHHPHQHEHHDGAPAAPGASWPGHGRTLSTDHLMVPDRADTAPERRRRESLDLPPPRMIPAAPAPAPHNPPRTHSHPQPYPQPSSTPITHPPTTHHPRPAPTAAPTPTPTHQQPREPRRPDTRDPHTPRARPTPLVEPERMRKLSSTEILYPSPEAAKRAFDAQRAANPNPPRRRPTPHTSRAGRRNSVRRIESDRSIRSRVSFDSTRSRGSGRISDGGYESDGFSDVGEVGLDPSFGSTNGIGPAGEAIEVIGLGRKKPRHRTFQAAMLKPALRSSSSVNSRAEMRDGAGAGLSGLDGGMGQEKPLPSRPMSYIDPVIGTFSQLLGGASRPARTRGQSHQPTPSGSAVGMGFDSRQQPFPQSHTQQQQPQPPTTRVRSHSRSMSQPGPAPAGTTGGGGGGGGGLGLRSLFSNLSVTDSHSHTGNPPAPPPGPAAHTRPRITPADDLLDYLRFADVPVWDMWPGGVGKTPSTGGIWGMGMGMGMSGGGRGKGLEGMSWEWHRRADLAEGGIFRRTLVEWESKRGWQRHVLEFQAENMPSLPIDMGNRWGAQIFALDAPGYDTLEFFDQSARESEDNGILSWLNGTILQTAVSALHMLRGSSSSFTFHITPPPRPPHLPPPTSPSRNQHTTGGSGPQYLWEGIGTMVLVNKNFSADRSMIIEIRPPSVLDSGVIKEFARSRARSTGGEGWWAFHKDACVGDVGQANLLQAQVYDNCVQNGVFFFAVTNLKYWVFGKFNADYTVASVSPVIDRRSKEPSLMQCLTTWVIQSFDLRPRAHGDQFTQAHSGAPPPFDRSHSMRAGRPSQSQPRPSDAPPYTEGRQRRRQHHSSLPAPAHGTYDPFTPNATEVNYPVGNTFQQMPHQHQGMAGNGMANNGMAANGYGGMPGYFDSPGQPMPPGAYPQPAMGMNSFGGMCGWNGVAGPQRAFSPVGVGMNGAPFNNGMSWYGGGVFQWPGMG